MRVIPRGVAAVILAMAGYLGPSAVATARPSPGEPTLVAVSATAGARLPLAGARVRILAGGRPLSQDNGARSGRTSQGGALLLSVRRLPRRFTIQVTPRGGLGGRFEALVHRYRSGGVVYVNPVTTVIAEMLSTHRPAGRALSAAQARRAVYRVLAIPDAETQDDLLYTDRVFDGRSYLRAARKAGGIDALDRALVRAALGHGPRHRFTGPAGSSPSPVLFSAGPGGLVLTVFKELAKFAGSSITGVAGHKFGETVLGWVLAAFGLDQDPGFSEQLTEINDKLDRLSQQITELRGDVARAGFSTLLHQTDSTLGDIDTAWESFRAISELSATTLPSDKASYTQKLLTFIDSKLLGAPRTLNHNLGSDVPLADNVIKSASRTLSSEPFFDAHSSNQIISLYDYFAAYQAKLAVLLTEYYHAESKSYPPTVAPNVLKGLDSQVTAQAESLKPPVPKNTVLDTSDGLMWMQNVEGSSVVPLDRLLAIGPYGIPPTWRLKAAATATGLPGLPFDNWSLPTFDDMNRLLSNRDKKSPYDWLAQDARISPDVLKATQSHFWLRNTFYTEIASTYPSRRDDLCYELYSLQIASTAARTCKPIRYLVNTPQVPSVEQGTLYVRRPAPDEKYWWGG